MIRKILESIREKEFTPRGDVLEPAGGGMKLDDVTHFLDEMGWQEGSGVVPDDYAPVTQDWVHPNLGLGFGKGWKAHVTLRIPVVPGPQNSWSFGEDVEYATVADMPDSVEHYDDLESFKWAVAAVMQKYGVEPPHPSEEDFRYSAVVQKLGEHGFQLSKFDPSGPKHPGRGWVWMVNPEYQNVEVVVSVDTEAQTSPWSADPVEYVSIDANGQTKYTSKSMDELDHHLEIVGTSFMQPAPPKGQPGAGPPYTVSLQWLWGDEDQMKDLGPFDAYEAAVKAAKDWKKGIEKNLKQIGAVTAMVLDRLGEEVVLNESVLEKEFTPRADVVEPEGGGKKTSALHDFLVGQGWDLSDFGIGKDDDEASNYYTHPGVAGPNGVAWISLRDKGHFDDDAEWVAGDEFVGASGGDGGLLGHGGDEVELAYDDVIPFAKKVVAAAEDPVPAPGLGDLVMGLVKGWGVEKAWKGVVAAVAEKDWLSTNESGQPPSNENPMNIYPIATGKMLNVLKKTVAQQKEEIAKVLAKLKLPSEWDGGIEAFRVWPSPDVPDEDNAQTFGMLIDVLGKHVYGE